jgi:hypothetical protein
MHLEIPPDDLKRLVQEVVREALTTLEQARARISTDRLAYSEPEAARLLGLKPWQIRDERLRGRIKAVSVVGRRIRYTPESLRDYLTRGATIDDSAE